MPILDMELAEGGRRQGGPGIVATTIIFGGRKMKRILLFSLMAVLISPDSVSAVLTVYEYIPGEKVTLDSSTGDYWYWNLADFVNMTYDEQITAIAGLGTYGYIAGGWHMATQSEMASLWANDSVAIASGFSITGTTILGDHLWRGRYDEEGPPWAGPGWHLASQLSADPTLTFFDKVDLSNSMILNDILPYMDVGAWVTTDAALVPVPGAVVLTASGLLSMLGFKRWRRKR